MNDAGVSITFSGVRDMFRTHRKEWFERVEGMGEISDPFILGSAVEDFEREFASYLGVKHCVSVGNGLDAIALALRALGVSEGHEVIVPAQTFHATYLAVLTVGAVPVPVDVKIADGNMNPDLIADALTRRTRAIVPVHLHGTPADMASILHLAKEHGLHVVEDAAQAHGARTGAGKVGSLGDAAAFSFYPTKNLGALGDGGCVTTSDDDVADRIRAWRSYSPAHSLSGVHVGGNSRLDSVQAAWLSIALPRLDDWNRRRQEIARRYWAELSGTGLLPAEEFPERSVWHHFTIMVNDRSWVMQELQARGIPVQVHYETAAYARPEFQGVLPPGIASREYPAAEARAANLLSLPMHPWLSEESVNIVVHEIMRAISSP